MLAPNVRLPAAPSSSSSSSSASSPSTRTNHSGSSTPLGAPLSSSSLTQLQPQHHHPQQQQIHKSTSRDRPLLCNPPTASRPLARPETSIGPTPAQASLSQPLPHQLSQLCNNQQYQLSALQQNFKHLQPHRNNNNTSSSSFQPPSTPATTSTNSTPAPPPPPTPPQQHHAGAPSSSSSSSNTSSTSLSETQHQPPSFLPTILNQSLTMNNNTQQLPSLNHRINPQDPSNYRYNLPQAPLNHHTNHNNNSNNGATGPAPSSSMSRHHIHHNHQYLHHHNPQLNATTTNNSANLSHSHHYHHNHNHNHHNHNHHHSNSTQINNNINSSLNDYDSAHQSTATTTTNNNNSINRNHHNWRKSKSSTSRGSNSGNSPTGYSMPSSGGPSSLLDLSAKVVAEHTPFHSIELRYDHIPEPVQRRIIFWSFPRHEDDIKMYSSLSSDTFNTNAQAATPAGANNNVNNSNNATQSPSSMRLFPIWDPAHGQPPQQPQQQQQPQQVDNPQNNPTGTSSSNSNTNPSARIQSQQLTFHKGLRLYNEGRVHDVLQVGFNLTGSVSIKVVPAAQSTNTNSRTRGNNNNSHSNNNNANPDNQHHHNDALANHHNRNSSSINDITSTSQNDSSSIKHYRVSVTFDRCKITSVSCSCDLQDIFWCEHVVALILYRIRNPETIELRVPISETLLSLDRQQLQKLVQYIIAEHHTEVLPTAQRLLDEMRQSFSEINRIQGAPDPTAGACADDDHIWHLDENQVNEKVQGYLNLVCSNSKDAAKQIVALFEKIREMFRAKDSNGIRLLKLITEQFLQVATRNDKSRPLWDQLVSLWVVVMLNPDLTEADKNNFVYQLNAWSKIPKCPKEDIERRISTKRKAAELSDDEDGEDFPFYCNGEYSMSYNQSNNYPAHMATHRHRSFQANNSFPVLRSYNQLPILPPACSCQLSNPFAKKMRSQHFQQNNETSSSYLSFGLRNNKSSSSLNSQSHQPRSFGHSSNNNENRPIIPQEPRSIFRRALDFQSYSWNDPHLQLVLNRDGPIAAIEQSQKSNLFDFTGNPLWTEGVPQAAARVETLRSHGYRDQALKLAVATVRRLKLQQDQWCHAFASDSNQESPCMTKSFDHEGWLGHPFDPINVLMDILLDASQTETVSSPSNPSHGNDGICTVNSARCSCPYNQALADFTHRLLPDLASLSYQHRVDGFPMLPLVNLAQKRQPTSPNQNSEKALYYHVTVPGCCQKDSYLTLAFEIALIALGQQRSIPTTATAHDRAVRQEAELISKLESIDSTDPILVGILKHQTTLLLEGGPFQSSCCGIAADSAPLHTFSRYLFDSLLPHYPQLAYKVGVYALKMPLVTDENVENFGAARTSPRSINHNHLQAEQLALAQTMLSKARDETQQGVCLRKVYRASVKTIKNPAILLKLSKHVLKEARPGGTTMYPALLKTSFDLGLQVLKATLSPHTSNSKVRREAIQFIVECATDIGLEAVLQIMKDSRDYFSAIEALNLVVAPHTLTNDQVNIRLLALSKLKLNENPMREIELNRRSRDLALECANRDPTNCALEALKFCECDDEALRKALLIVITAGTNRAMDSTLLIKVADYIHDKGMTEKAFELALVAVDSLTILSNSDNSSSKKDIFSACEYAQRVNGFSTLIPKLINNIECATVLSDIYEKFSPSLLMASSYRSYGDGVLSYKRNLTYNKEYNDILNSLNPELYKQRVEDARWWAALLKKTLKAFVDTTRTRLQNISPRHYGEFIDFLIKAQGTFEKAADGPQQFKDLIFEIIKSYRTKKKLMERLKLQFKKSIEMS